MDIAKKVESITSAVVELRRRIHQNPELGMQELATTKLIVDELAKLPNIDVKDCAPGVIATLKGKKPGKTLALRADMDALPITEESAMPFASQNAGVCHACGHDMHTAILLGCAMVLSSMADELSGTIKFFFQPAEETLQGAQHLLKNGALESPKVEAILGVHCSPLYPAGTARVKSGSFMAAADALDITITGRPGHAAYPHRSIDSIAIAAQVITALQTVVSRETDPLEPAVVTLCTINGGTARNIIAPQVTMSGTVRTITPAVREHMAEKITRIATHTAEALGGKAKVDYVRGTPPVTNDKDIAELITRSAGEIIGQENVGAIEKPVMGAEDFAFYLEKVPGALFHVGTANDDEQTRLALHNSKVRFDEGALPVGVKVLCQAAVNYLK